MENITLGQIKDIILFIVALVGGIATLYSMLMKGIKKQLEPINDELKAEKMSRLKSDLTTLMYLAETGAISNEQKILAHEEYDVYVENKGNSYIHDKFESLHKEGKI
jgi:hypothetical protein